MVHYNRDEKISQKRKRKKITRKKTGTFTKEKKEEKKANAYLAP